jgi:hypothetical protein
MVRIPRMRAKRRPVEVDPTERPGVYYEVQRLGPTGWRGVGGSYKTALDAQWARAKMHVENKALSISATRVRSWSWS